MNTSLKWLLLASLTNLVGNVLGTMLALQYNLTGDFGSWLNGQDVLRDFLTFKGTALSAPLPFLLIQLGLTILALRPGRSGRIGAWVDWPSWARSTPLLSWESRLCCEYGVRVDLILPKLSSCS